MKNVITILASFIICYNANAQQNRIWATYYGGLAEENFGLKTATDALGNVYLCGGTSSTTGIASGGFQNTYGGGTYDAFLVKFDANGNRLWATYYGGAGVDYSYDVDVDNAGNVYLHGQTSSSSGIAFGGFQNSIGGVDDDFLVKFDANGNRIWATYYGGTQNDYPGEICIDLSGNIYIAAYTASTSSIAAGGFQNTFGGGPVDAFLVKFNSSGARLWASYYGGPSYDYGYNVDTDLDGNVFLAGYSESSTAIASGGFQNTYAGGGDAFLVKFDSLGVRQWATYYGGAGYERGLGISIDFTGNIYLCGHTSSTSGISSGGFQNTYGGGTSDGYFVKFNTMGARLFASYFGGAGYDDSGDMVINSSNEFVISGSTDSPSGIALGGFQNVIGGSGVTDAFIARFDATGNILAATYYGGTGNDAGFGICTDTDGNIYLAGRTTSTSGIASGGFQNTYGGGTFDAMLVKFTSCTLAPSSPASISGATNICDGSSNTYSIPPVSGATSYTWTLPSGWTGISSTNSITTTASPASGNITVTANNGCGSSAPATLAITVNSLPATPGSISGSDSICSGSSNTYSISPVAGATSYTWVLPVGWTGSSATNSISVTDNGTSGTVSVTADNMCGNSAAATLAITVNTIPSTPGTVSGAATICEGTSNSYSVAAVSGATYYTWTLPSGWSGSSTTNSITTTSSGSSGSVTVTANNTCGSSSPQTLPVIVNALPNVSLTLLIDSFCLNSPPLALSGGSPSGGVFTGPGVSGGNFDPSVSGIGSFIITYTFTDVNSCTNTATDNIVVDACLGFEESNEAAQMLIYPSPTTGMFTLILPGMENTIGTITIYNSLGEIIFSARTTAVTNQIDLSDFEKGIYFISINDGTKFITKKIIRE